MVDYIKFINSLDGFLLPELREIITSYFIREDFTIYSEWPNKDNYINSLEFTCSIEFTKYKKSFISGRISFNTYKEIREYYRKLNLFFEQVRKTSYSEQSLQKYKDIHDSLNFGDFSLLGTILEESIKRLIS